MTDLTVMIGTCGTRPEMLAQVEEAFERENPDAEVIVCEGVSWGAAMNEMAEVASGRYLLTACDDTLPRPGWFGAARAMVDQGVQPACRFYELDGSITPTWPGLDGCAHGTPVPWTRLMLLTPEILDRVGPLIDASWYVDIDYANRMRAAGIEILACDGYEFTHLDGARDWKTPEEDARCRREFERSQARLAAA